MHTETPTRVLVAGDWHGYAPHAVHVIRRAAALLDGEPQKIVLQAGDFGILPGPGALDYLHAVLTACYDNDVRVWFTEGNHDDPALLTALEISGEERQYVNWLPRGHRWEWHGRTWLAMGGGVSLDKAGPPCLRCTGRGAYQRQMCPKCGGLGRFPRVEGESWWPEEDITLAQAEKAMAAGPADVLLSHDCPARVVHAFPDRPWWYAPEDLLRSEANAELLQCIATGTRVKHVIHGHLHMGYQRMCDFGYGPVTVTGLDREPRPDMARRPKHSTGILDIKEMIWDMAV
jgi:Calcineurin-like phosphoesterase